MNVLDRQKSIVLQYHRFILMNPSF